MLNLTTSFIRTRKFRDMDEDMDMMPDFLDAPSVEESADLWVG